MPDNCNGVWQVWRHHRSPRSCQWRERAGGKQIFGFIHVTQHFLGIFIHEKKYFFVVKTYPSHSKIIFVDLVHDNMQYIGYWSSLRLFIFWFQSLDSIYAIFLESGEYAYSIYTPYTCTSQRTPPIRVQWFSTKKYILLCPQQYSLIHRYKHTAQLHSIEGGMLIGIQCKIRSRAFIWSPFGFIERIKN